MRSKLGRAAAKAGAFVASTELGCNDAINQVDLQ